MEGPKLEWGRVDWSALSDRWPRGEDGSPELPRFLCHRSCVDMSDRIFVNMLESYGVPCLCVDPGNGGFARVVMGMSGQGVDIYVPESLYDDAIALSKEENNEEL